MPDQPFKVYPLEFFYIINASNTIERVLLNDGILYSNVWLYPSKAVDVGANAGLLLPNTADVYWGLSGYKTSTTGIVTPQYTTDVLRKEATNDGIEVVLANGSRRISINQIIIRGTVGDGVFVRAIT